MATLITVYSFDELPLSIQKKVLKKYGDINIGHEWYKPTYEDAQQVGIKIIEFDLSVKCDIMIDEAINVANSILQNHGNHCDTYTYASQFLNGEINDDLFHNKIAMAYLEMLNEEYNYLTSEEGIKESLYDKLFTQTGQLIS